MSFVIRQRTTKSNHQHRTESLGMRIQIRSEKRNGTSIRNTILYTALFLQRRNFEILPDGLVSRCFAEVVGASATVEAAFVCRANLRRRSARVMRGGPTWIILLEEATERLGDFSPLPVKWVILFDTSLSVWPSPFCSSLVSTAVRAPAVRPTLRAVRDCDNWSKRVIENALPGE